MTLQSIAMWFMWFVLVVMIVVTIINDLRRQRSIKTKREITRMACDYWREHLRAIRDSLKNGHDISVTKELIDFRHYMQEGNK